VHEQVANSQYYVHGQVVGSSWAEMEPATKRPYTYWRISVHEQLYGAGIGSEIVVRQPGGEIGDMGYHVAGAAEFAGGEQVFIALRDTDQNSGVKEVVGLASGKFRVEQNSSGEKIVMSGLGLPVSGSDGKALSPEEFSDLLKRFASNQATAADRNVFVSRNPTHELDHSPAARIRETAATQLRTLSGSRNTDTKIVETPASTHENRVQKRSPSSEESSTGSSATIWIIAAALLLSLFVGLAFALKR